MRIIYFCFILFLFYFVFVLFCFVLFYFCFILKLCPQSSRSLDLNKLFYALTIVNKITKSLQTKVHVAYL